MRPEATGVCGLNLLVDAGMQVAFKGYAGTLGAEFVDHLVSDARASPPEFARSGYEALSY